jgi:hypothetical protein
LSRFLRALEKVGLVEVEARADAPVAAPEPEPAAIETPSPASVEAAVGTPAAPGTPIDEQRAFDAIYADAQLAPSPFPAEKLLRILDGLAALAPESRKAAVLALDAADEAWTIDDGLLDAERKIKLLTQAKAQVEEQARAALAHARSEIDAREQRQQEAVGRIRQQIADLEGLLEREIARATEDKAALQETARVAKDACVRESARFDAEATRLRRLAEIFSTSPATSNRS